jgi:uncharacterized membrane protein
LKLPVLDKKNIYRQQSNWNTTRSVAVMIACIFVFLSVFLFNILIAFCLAIIITKLIFKVSNIKIGFFLVYLFLPLGISYSNSAYLALSDIVAQMIFFGFVLFILFSVTDRYTIMPQTKRLIGCILYPVFKRTKTNHNCKGSRLAERSFSQPSE